MSKIRILVVDDEQGMLEVCHDILCKLPEVSVEIENDAKRAAERLAAESYDLLIADIRMPGLSGVDLLRSARQDDPDLAAIMITAFPTVETAVAAMKLGAADYITKPFLPADLRTKVQNLLVARHIKHEHRLLRRQVERPDAPKDIVGDSPTMRAVYDAIGRVASADVDVLILGETGVGKELVARSVHKQSARKEGRFVPIDCGAISEGLLESELFGHERGAFTGAHRQSLGLLEFADGGTCFLDEIANLPLRLQVKLLRALQERKFRRVGGTEEISVDVRIIAASNRDLAAEVRENRFAEDLYYRINVARIDIPPLRDRREDIVLLLEHFVNRYCNEMGKETLGIDSDVVEILKGYAWPGNVRELQNVVKRAIVMTSNEELRADDLPDEIVIAADNRSGSEREGFFQLREVRMAGFEKEYLTNLLRARHGDVSAAAREAKMPRGTMYRLLKKHAIEADDFRPDLSSAD